MKLQIENVKLQEDFKAKLQKELSEKLIKTYQNMLTLPLTPLRLTEGCLTLKQIIGSFMDL